MTEQTKNTLLWIAMPIGAAAVMLLIYWGFHRILDGYSADIMKLAGLDAAMRAQIGGIIDKTGMGIAAIGAFWTSYAIAPSRKVWVALGVTAVLVALLYFFLAHMGFGPKFV